MDMRSLLYTDNLSQECRACPFLQYLTNALPLIEPVIQRLGSDKYGIIQTRPGVSTLLIKIESSEAPILELPALHLPRPNVFADRNLYLLDAYRTARQYRPGDSCATCLCRQYFVGVLPYVSQTIIRLHGSRRIFRDDDLYLYVDLPARRGLPS